MFEDMEDVIVSVVACCAVLSGMIHSNFCNNPLNTVFLLKWLFWLLANYRHVYRERYSASFLVDKNEKITVKV